jgi:hypothetical protein
MSKAKSLHQALTWTNSVSVGESAELDRLTRFDKTAEQSVSNIHDSLKYVHVDFAFYDVCKFGQGWFREPSNPEGVRMTKTPVEGFPRAC